ncbi:PREDICTED: sialic acid synthase-like [Papilio polytes]|uniref:sialic acid synthase-like n=1 Tax=Papilio polytes TaxID=76194 RepID=UPI0006766EB9|nr:PREDICTED: sialic acid synthase-like [Papilio polytes]
MNTVILTNNVKIGGNSPCFIIAEIGQNHQGDIEIAKKLIKAAKEAGADCVKFQKSNLEEKFTKQRLEQPYNNTNSWGSTYGDHKRHLEFTKEQYRILLKYSQDLNILFTASAMDMESFNFLLSLKVPFIKIGSGDSNNLLFIKYAASKKVPLIVSTGMIDKATVTTIYNMISSHHKQFCLLHCVSAYPTPYEDCNLRVLQDYANSFNIPVGYSGHELGIKVVIAAVALGAKVIEKHITLDRSMKGTDHQCSLVPSELQQLVRSVRSLELALRTPVKMMHFVGMNYKVSSIKTCTTPFAAP